MKRPCFLTFGYRLLVVGLWLVALGCLPTANGQRPTANALAYDFRVPVQGYFLYFNVIDSSASCVEVTAPRTAGNYRWGGEKAPTGVLEIPAEVENEGVKYTVAAIAERAFSGCSKITGVVLPATLTDIGAYAFSNCTGIRGTLVIGERMAGIGKSAFYGCTGIAELQFNAAACAVMGGARNATVFAGCRSMKKIAFGPQVRRIPDYAFAGMDALKGELALPENITAIGSYSFAYCNALSSVVLPAKVAEIGDYAFTRCPNLKQVTANALMPPAVGTEAFSGISAVATLVVPCLSEQRYSNAEEWKRIRHIKKMEPCTLEIAASVNDPQMGMVVGSGQHVIGDTITLTAICYAGYGFKGWSDGNTDNPRRVAVTDTFSCTAIMQVAEVRHEVEYIHDTIYKDGIETIYEYFEVGDIAEPIDEQDEVVYNQEKRRIEVPIDRKDIVSVALYNDAGVCVSTGKPRWGHINMKRYPTGYYIVRITTSDTEQAVRFLHVKK